MDWVFERFDMSFPRKLQGSRIVVELTETEKQLAQARGLLGHVVFEFVDGREQRARELDEKHGILGYAFGMLIKPESRSLKSDAQPVHEKARRNLTVRNLINGYEFLGTAIEVDDFEHNLSLVLEEFEQTMDKLISGDRQVTVRRRKPNP